MQGTPRSSKKNPSSSDAVRAFTLIELMVSVTLFVTVMLISVGALMSLVNANRKARSLESVINNLNVALDGMVRSVRMGSDYNCGALEAPIEGTNEDCPTGGVIISFTPFGSDPSANGERWVFTYVPPSGTTNGQIFRSRDGGVTDIPITAPEVSITDMNFYVVGTEPGDTVQPKVVMVVKGRAGSSPKNQTTFYVQATASQRSLDI